MNVPDDAAFVARAIALGNDAGLRAGLREELAQRRLDSSLFDMRGFAADFAALTTAVAQHHGLRPA
ncbi:hypothetical protein D3C81_2100540 [compost metagenome]